MITSKDDATASLLGFAIANRVDSSANAKDELFEGNAKTSAKIAKEEAKEAKEAASAKEKAFN